MGDDMDEETVVISIGDLGVLDATPYAGRYLKTLIKEVGTPQNALVVIEVMRATLELGGMKLTDESYEAVRNILVEEIMRMKMAMEENR